MSIVHFDEQEFNVVVFMNNLNKKEMDDTNCINSTIFLRTRCAFRQLISRH